MADGDVDVPLGAPIVIILTEEIGPLAFDLALASEIAVDGIIWNEPGMAVLVHHDPFSPGQVYTATVLASNAFANTMSAPGIWSFTTRPMWEVYLPMIARENAESTTAVRVRMSKAGGLIR